MSVIEWILIILLVLISVITTFSKIISAIKEIKDYLKSKSVNIKKEINALELSHYTNVRFNFSFDAPKIWDRKDPANSDGCTLVNPKNEAVKILAWGSYFTSEMIKELDLNINEYQNSKLIQKTYSGQNVYEYLESENNITLLKEDIEGERSILEFIKDKKRLRAVLFKAEFDKRRLTIQCESPKRIFNLYEDLFYKVGKSLKVLK